MNRALKGFYFLCMMILWQAMSGQISDNSTPQEAIESVVNAIQKGQMDKLEPFLDLNFQLHLEGIGAIGRKPSPKNQLESFLSSNPCQALSILHKGNSENKLYVLTTYRSTQGTFMVNIFFKESDGAYKIERIRIQKE